jgi:hypothetical protein
MTKAPEKTKAKAKARKPTKQAVLSEGSLVARSLGADSQLGAYLSKAMEDAIKDCIAEGQLAPQVIKERMKEYRDAAVAEYDALAGGGG